jgi:hypothetical protein
VSPNGSATIGNADKCEQHTYVIIARKSGQSSIQREGLGCRMPRFAGNELHNAELLASLNMFDCKLARYGVSMIFLIAS